MARATLNLWHPTSKYSTYAKMCFGPWSVFLGVLVAFSSQVICAPEQSPLPDIHSPSVIVVDLQTDTTLLERNADVIRPIASISKLFAALVITEDCKLDPQALHEMTTANRIAAKGGDKTRLTTGWSYSHLDLLHAALLRSDNRAIPALAEACGLTPAELAVKMTAKAHKLGLLRTNFKEPTGLSAENVSTAREVLVALKESMSIPALTAIMSKGEYTIVAHKDQRVRPVKIRNTDRLITKNLAQILAGKTGYTDIARYCLAVAARLEDGRDVGMVFLGGEGRYTRFADFTRIVKWLAANNTKVVSATNAPDQQTTTANAAKKLEALLPPAHTPPAKGGPQVGKNPISNAADDQDPDPSEVGGDD